LREGLRKKRRRRRRKRRSYALTLQGPPPGMQKVTELKPHRG
jgi:hypothetical protein